MLVEGAEDLTYFNVIGPSRDIVRLKILDDGSSGRHDQRVEQSTAWRLFVCQEEETTKLSD